MNLSKITNFIQNQIPEPPNTAMILGSGLGGITDKLSGTLTIPYGDIPDFPQSTVSGHKGEWVFGYLGSSPVLCARGRFHYYEGLPLEQVSLPVQVIHSLGCKSLLITNAAGCLVKDWQLGDFMLTTAFLDYSFRNGSQLLKIIPLKKDGSLAKSARNTAVKQSISLHEGTYTWTLGPSYETVAEVQAIIKLGSCAVGMSTVPEIKAAVDLNMEFIVISCLTNYGAGLEDKTLDHHSVLNMAERVETKYEQFVIGILNSHHAKKH